MILKLRVFFIVIIASILFDQAVCKGGEPNTAKEPLLELAEQLDHAIMDFSQSGRNRAAPEIDEKKKNGLIKRLDDLKILAGLKKADNVTIEKADNESDKMATKLLSLKAELSESVDFLNNNSDPDQKICIVDSMALVNKVTELCTNNATIINFFKVENCMSRFTPERRKDVFAVLKPFLRMILLVLKPLGKNLLKALFSDIITSWKKNNTSKSTEDDDGFGFGNLHYLSLDSSFLYITL